MKRYRLIFLVLLTAVLLACQPATPSTPEARAPASSGEARPTAAPGDSAEPPATIEASADDWITFTSDEGGFTLRLPAQPKEQRRPIENEAGSTTAIMYITEVGNTAFGAGFSDFPESAANTDPGMVLAGARDGAAKKVNGTVVDEKAIEINGHPGMEVKVNIPAAASMPGGATYRARLYLVNNRLYQVIYVALKKDEVADEYQKLFASFQLTHPPAPRTPAVVDAPTLKDWFEYRSDEGGFIVRLPAEPKVTTQSTATAAGPIELTMALAETDHCAAVVSFNDIPIAAMSDPDTLLQGGRDGVVKKLNGTIVSERPVTLDDYPGLEFVLETSKSQTYMIRIYIVNDRLYQLLFLSSKSRIDQFDVQGFFESFQLLKQ